MKINRLSFFSQQDVDTALGETIRSSDKSVVGTLVMNNDGSYVTWQDLHTATPVTHRLCIEHAPDEYVDYFILHETDTMFSANHYIPRVEHNKRVADIKRIGFIPTRSYPSFGIIRNHMRICTKRGLTDELIGKDLSYSFFCPPEWSRLNLEVEGQHSPAYCEIDALDIMPFVSSSFAISHVILEGDCVLYYVYKIKKTHKFQIPLVLNMNNLCGFRTRSYFYDFGHLDFITIPNAYSQDASAINMDVTVAQPNGQSSSIAGTNDYTYGNQTLPGDLVWRPTSDTYISYGSILGVTVSSTIPLPSAYVSLSRH